VPELLLRVAAVHDGLAPLWGSPGWFADALLPLGCMEPITARVRFGEENILYRPEDLLRFHADGQGGGWCVLRPEGCATVWDAGSHGLGPTIPLEAALSRVVSTWVAPSAVKR